MSVGSNEHSLYFSSSLSLRFCHLFFSNYSFRSMTVVPGELACGDLKSFGLKLRPLSSSIKSLSLSFFFLVCSAF